MSGRRLAAVSTPDLVRLLDRRPELRDTCPIAAALDEAIRWNA